MSELDLIRTEIDEIDTQLLSLITKRMDCAKRVAEYKRKNNLPVLNSGREQQILDSVSERAGEYGNAAKVIYSTLMDVSRALQHNMLNNSSQLRASIDSASTASKRSFPVIACQGVKGAYSDEAAHKMFPQAEYRFFNTWSEVFEAVKNGDVDFGVLPVENSTAGSVNEVYDLILDYKFYICGGVELTINHSLLANSGTDVSDIDTVYSHPQALAQCRDYINEHGFASQEYLNTAMAAQMVAESGKGNIAAIGSERNAKVYGLNILARNIQSCKNNRTRFIAISKQLYIPENANKVSLAFALPHSEGALYRVLGRFAIHGLNLEKIESRPIAGSEFEYYFYLDFSGNVHNRKVTDLLCALADELPSFTFLGNYIEVK